MSRGSRAVPEIRANCGVPMADPGVPNSVRLNKLNDSMRNCSLRFSPIGMFLKSEKSQLLMPGPIKCCDRRYPSETGRQAEKRPC